jgi:hypothetical protein
MAARMSRRRRGSTMTSSWSTGAWSEGSTLAA